MASLGVPLVDAAQIVEGNSWASKRTDGRHYHPIVPLEVIRLLEVLTSPMPSPLIPKGEEKGGEPRKEGPSLSTVAIDRNCP